MSPLDGMVNEYPAGSGPLDGSAANALGIPDGAGSVLIESMGAEIRFRAGKVTTASPNKPTAGAPGAVVSDGSAGGWLPMNAAQTYRLLDPQGQALYTHLALLSAAGVRLTWYAK